MLVELVAHEGPMLEMSIPMERTYAGLVLEELQPIGKTHIGSGAGLGIPLC